MSLLRGNDSFVDSDPITDADGNPLTVGTVKMAVLSRDKATEYIADAAASHQAAGVWRRSFSAQQMDTIPAAVRRAKTRLTVGDPIDATWYRVEQVHDRMSS